MKQRPIKVEYNKEGKYKGLMKTLEYYMPKKQEQAGKSTAFPLAVGINFDSSSLNVVMLEFPNGIGIKKVTIEFDYDDYWGGK